MIARPRKSDNLHSRYGIPTLLVCHPKINKEQTVFKSECRFESLKPLPFFNHKNYNFLACDWFKKVLFSTNSLAKLLSDSLLDSLSLDSLLSNSSKSQSHSKM